LFLHKYALAIGWPVPLLRKIMTARDIAEAMAYDRINPFGEERADYRAGVIASTVVNVNKTCRDSFCDPSDFMPDFSKKKESKDMEKLHSKILGVFGFGNDS
jgi:hypothetical protein